MNKNDIYKLLNNKKIWHEIVEHEAVYNKAEKQKRREKIFDKTDGEYVEFEEIKEEK